MNEDLRQKAKKKVEAKMAFFICGITFFFTTIVLIMLSLYMPSVAIWLLLPVPMMGMVLGILFINVFGFPTSATLSTTWREEEIEKEMIRIYREEKAAQPLPDDLSELDRLELEALERLQEERMDRDENYVE